MLIAIPLIPQGGYTIHTSLQTYIYTYMYMYIYIYIYIYIYVLYLQHKGRGIKILKYQNHSGNIHGRWGLDKFG